LLFHPISFYILGFLVWLFIPPFFVEDGHNWFIIALDIFAMFFFIVGIFNGKILKTLFFGKLKLKANKSNFNLFLFIFVSLLYLLRAYHYSQVGIFSILHPNASESRIIFTIKSQLVAPYTILLWYGALIAKNKFCKYLLFIEVFITVIPIMSRSSYLYFCLYGISVYVFFNGLTRQYFKRFALLIIGVLVLINTFGPALHNIRSQVYVGNINSLFDQNFLRSDNKSSKFLINRLNLHGNYKLIKGHEKWIAELDYESLKSIPPKLLGFVDDYKVRPVSVSRSVGEIIGFASATTSTAYPRNIILYHLGEGILNVGIFSLILGVILSVLFHLLYSPKNIFFIVFGFPIIFSYAFGNKGALIGAMTFQFIFFMFSCSIPVIIYYLLKFSKKALRVIIHK
jgi:hypothetical protein